MKADRIVNLLNKLVLFKEENLTLSRKIHILITFLAVLLLLFETGLNLFIGMNFWINLFTALYVVIGLAFYLLSRNDKYYQKSVLPLFIFSILLFSIVWIFNAGYDGNNVSLLILLFLVIYAIVQQKYRQIVFLTFLTLFSALSIVQYYFPHIIFPYTNRDQRFIDLFLGNFFYFIFIYLIINLIIKSYIAENAKVIQVNAELKHKNEEIADSLLKLRESSEELKKAKEKAEESDRLKTAFLYNISHEIRTPFNGILGFLSIIQDYELQDTERDEYIGIINQSADRLMNTINEIVEISQIQAGQMQVTTSEINIKMLIDELIDQFKYFTEIQKLKFNINNELPNKITCISTDGIKLKTILSNLVGNAFKFTKAGSIELEIRQKGDYLEFSIKDSGIGFPENKIKIIFERFMQADVSKTREYEGLGLGLSIATAYVKMLGGKIWAKSEVGKGSTFFFTIKCNIKPE
jgi:signal transduction histidine kinase